jgi:hypothetical protein
MSFSLFNDFFSWLGAVFYLIQFNDAFNSFDFIMSNNKMINE